MKSVKDTISERTKTHGDFTELSKTSQMFKAVIQTRGMSTLTPDKLEALDMIVHKMARILHGDPNNSDHWHDIAGYASLIEKSCSENK